MKILIITVFLNILSVGFTQPTCTTPNGEKATCLPIKECQTFINTLKNKNETSASTIDFLRESSCGFRNGGPFVCCGNVSHYKTPSSADPRKHRNFHLLPIHCGFQDANDGIPGDIEAQLEEFPWMALVEYRNKTGDSLGHQCGATLISEQYVVTAAHCVTGRVLSKLGEPFQIRLGDHDLNTEIDCHRKSDGTQQYELCNADYQDAEIERIIPHPNFDLNGQSHNDIALIRLKQPVKRMINVQPICLPVYGETSQSGKRVFGAGWGATLTNRASEVKLKVSVPIVSNEKCHSIYNQWKREIVDTQLCAGGELGVDTCQGDSGGPVMTPRPRVGSVPSQWYIEGIISFGPKPCGREGVPSVHTRMASFVNWILDHME